MGADLGQITAECPECGAPVLFTCEWDRDSALWHEAAPHVLGSLVGDVKPCEKCGAVLTVVAERPRIEVSEPQPGACPFRESRGLGFAQTVDLWCVFCNACHAEGPRAATTREAIVAWNEAAR